jgi:hypothetical protein
MKISKDWAYTVGFALLVVVAVVWTVAYYFFLPCGFLEILPAKDVPGRCFR